MFNKVDSLDQFIQVTKILKEAIPADLSIAICDREKFLTYMPGKEINLAIQVGQKLHPEEPLAVALRTNQRLQAEVPAQFYGFEFIGTATPIHNAQNEVIGGIAVQVKKRTELINISNSISQSLIKANEQISQIAAGSAMLTDVSTTLMAQSTQAEENVKQTGEILTLMKRMAMQTNLLGLNAAIEAARAGEMGKGFNIVATEIRKFSSDTTKSTEEIQKTMRQIYEVTEEMIRSVEKVSNVGEQQQQSIYNVLDFIKEIQAMSTELTQFAKKI